MSNTIIENIRNKVPKGGWKNDKTGVTSIIFTLKEPVRIDETVSKHWVLLVEPNVLKECQIASADIGGPTGWTLGEIVYEDESIQDREAIKWMAKNYEQL